MRIGLGKALFATTVISATIVVVGLGNAVLNVLAPATVIFAIAVILYAGGESDDNGGGGLPVLRWKNFQDFNAKLAMLLRRW